MRLSSHPSVALASGRRKRVAVLGATGSIGRAALDVIARHPDRFELAGLAAHRDVAGMVDLCRTHRPRVAVLADADAAAALRNALAASGTTGVEVLAGAEGIVALAAEPDVDCVLAAIVGAAGVASTLAAARAGKQILLANKEAVVCAGALLADAVAQGGAHLVPIDSEHNAVFQCLPLGYADDPDRCGIERIVLTASGGPFRGRDAAFLASVTPEQACAHPNWRMGRKISVDSATLMNKGLEVIEAHWLFGLGPDLIDVVVHPQSIVHSLVAYRDGSMLAQLGNPDMRTALAVALGWPERIAAGVPLLDLVAQGRLDFEPPDRALFPCLNLAYRTLSLGGTAPAVLNAANEVAVAGFLEGRIGFTDIPEVVADALAAHAGGSPRDFDDVMDADRRARACAGRWLDRYAERK